MSCVMRSSTNVLSLIAARFQIYHVNLCFNGPYQALIGNHSKIARRIEAGEKAAFVVLQVEYFRKLTLHCWIKGFIRPGEAIAEVRCSFGIDFKQMLLKLKLLCFVGDDHSGVPVMAAGWYVLAFVA